MLKVIKMKLTTLFLIFFAVGALARPDSSMENASDADQNDSSASMEKMTQGQGKQGGQMATTAPLNFKYELESLYQAYVPGFVKSIVTTIDHIIPGIISAPINIPLDTLHTAIMQSDLINSALEDNPVTNILEQIPIMGYIVPYIAGVIGVPVNILNFVVRLIGAFISHIVI